MPEETLRQLKSKLEALVKTNPNYASFLEAVTAAETEISRLHRPDPNGRIPRMTGEDRSSLMRLHREIGMRAEAVLRSSANKTQTDLVKKITALAAGSHRALALYDPESAPKTLPALLEELRTLSLDTRGIALRSKLVYETNARQPISFLDSKGREFNGVFTPKRVIREIGETVREPSADLNRNSPQGKLSDKARLDTRNAAMSAVADLLGVPKLLARSRPMKLILPDGKALEGSFIQEAKGIDPENLDERAASIDSSAMSRDTQDERQTHGKALKSLADLQILDYLCGKADRKPRKLLYQFDQNNKLVSVQGIENDGSFGILEPDSRAREREPSALSEMKVISETMYNTVTELTPEILRFTLRGFGLSEGELEAAGRRLSKLKKTLQASDEHFKAPVPKEDRFPDSYLKRVKDEEWETVACAELARYRSDRAQGGVWHREASNLFAAADSAIQDMKGDYQKQRKAYRSLRSELAVGPGNRAIPAEQAREAEKAQKNGGDGRPWRSI